jgi:hypothetical protein
MPNSYKDKMATWNSLSELRNSIDLSSCIIGGDFNTHLNPGEKKGGSKVRDPFSENLTDLISDWDMQDIKPSKGKYTWNNRRSGLSHIAACLDHFLISSNLLLSPFVISSLILPFVVSDHKPISLSFLSPQNFAPLPFRFNQLWLDNPTIPPLVTNAWTTPFFGSPNFVWESKLKAVKHSQRMGEKLVHSSPTRKERKNRASRESSTPDRNRNGYRNVVESRKRGTTASSTHLVQRRRTLAVEIQKPLDKSGGFKHLFLPQASSISKEKKYSHLHYFKYREQLDSFDQVKEEAFHHFNNLYQQPIEEATNADVIDMLSNIPSIVSEHENNQLVKDITEEEIIKASLELGP